MEWTAADTHGNRELQGVPKELVRLFSKRTDQIDQAVQELAADGRERTPRLVKWAVHATRKAKEHEPADTLYGRWRTEAAERGVDADALVRQVTDRTQDRTVSEWTVAAMFDRLASPDGLTAQASTFARQDVIAALGGELAGATRVELEGLADRFLAERTVAVVAERAVEERRWSTPELLAVEQRLVATATDRIDRQTVVVSHDAVRAALDAHPTAGADQQAMLRDLCQGGAGVAVVVGRAGTDKTFALGAARHAWQMDGFRPLATAPTGIATVSLEAEGFEEVATCDRLLADLDRGREQLDSRTVLVVDEAGMLGSRKLARLLDHASQAQAKVVLVGDDRQLAPIDAGGGFRALRLRLGASELTENRRQHQAWEREALELVRSGLVEEAVVAYRAHDRVVAADSKPAATPRPAPGLVGGLAAGRTGPGPRGRGAGRPASRGRPAQHRLPGAPGRPGPPRRRAAAGRGPPARGRGPGRVRPHPEPNHPPGQHRRPDGNLAPVVSGWPRPRRAQPASGFGLCHHRPPGSRADAGAGPGPPHWHRRRQLALCAAVPRQE